MAVAANYAGFIPRFVSLFIDGVILAIVQFVLGLILASISPQLGNALGTLIAVAYQVYFFTSTGQTPGMKLMSIKVVNGSGELLSVGQAIVRFVVAILSGLVLLIGYLWMLWDSNKQTWHDKAAGSFVVRV
jgi:uncharacterized RDD family membrane protein YckC